MLMAKSIFVTVSMYGKLLLNLLDTTENSKITKEALLTLLVINEVKYNEKDVITNFTK